jgi:CheY-like chemotaxis protein
LRVKVLVVDDNPINQKFLFYSLKKYYEIETADNGLEAVEKLEDKSFDVVLMDLLMPVMDGAEATLRIRASENSRNKHIPIIFVTTNDFEHDRIRCLGNGGDDYLIKPVDINELLVSINFHLNLKQPLMN